MAVDKICGIYKITSPTGRVYIGQSKDINKRKFGYRNKDSVKQPLIYASVQKYGWSNHKHEVLEFIEDRFKLDEREIYWIAFYKSNKNRFPKHNGLNLTDGGAGRLGSKWSEETKIKLKGLKRCNGEKLDNCNLVESKKEYKEITLTKRLALVNKLKNKMQTVKHITYTGINNKNSKPVLNTQTGIYYDTIREAAVCYNLTYSQATMRIYKNSPLNTLQLI